VPGLTRLVTARGIKSGRSRLYAEELTTTAGRFLNDYGPASVRGYIPKREPERRFSGIRGR
jgi:hypothetical protein